MSTINKYIATENGITLSTSGTYTSPLTITATGGVYAYQNIAIDGPGTQAWTVINGGTIHNRYGLGIELFDGGYVDNTGRISTKSDAVSGATSVVNSGTITASAGYGVFQGELFNTGLISSQKGVVADGSVDNFGTILGTTRRGVLISGAGYVYNGATGLIQAPVRGIDLEGFSFGEVNNLGTVRDTGSIGSGIGVNEAGAYVKNAGLSSGLFGVYVYSGTVVNTGTILSTGPQGNYAGAGVYLATRGTLIDSGTISAAGTAVSFGGFHGTGTNVLVLESGYKITGLVVGSTSAGVGNVLELGGTAPVAFGLYHLEPLSGQFRNFQQLEVAAGADGTLFGGIGTAAPIGYFLDLGSATVQGGALDAAGITVKGGTLNNYGSIITGDLGLSVESGGILFNQLQGAISGVVVLRGTDATFANLGTITSADTLNAAVFLTSGGEVTNSGLIRGALGGIKVTGGSGMVQNAGTGTIAATGVGTAGIGVALYGGGLVHNGGGLLEGYRAGVYFGDVAGTIENFSTILGTGTNSFGAGLGFGGSIDNTGLIQGAIFGASINHDLGTLTNTGTILATATTGTQSFGVALAGGSVDNHGLIQGYRDGAYVGAAAGTLTNSGSILGTELFGVALLKGGSVGNSGLIQSLFDGVFVGLGGAGLVTNSGTIDGTALGAAGVRLLAGGTVVDSGTISGNSGTAAYFGGAGNNRLVLDPGYVLDGMAVGSSNASSVNTVELAGTAAGTVSGLGSKFVFFENLAVDPGAVWLANGTDSLTGTLSNAGSLGIGGVLDLGAGASGGGEIGFTGGGQTLIIGAAGEPAAFNNQIDNFDRTDTIDVAGVAATGFTYAGGVLTLSDGTQLKVSTRDNNHVFVLNPDGAGGTDVTLGVAGPALDLAPVAGLPPQSDLLWQDGPGAGMLWVMNGDSILQQATVGNPLGPTWQVEGTGYFDPNFDQSDVTLEDSVSGTVQIVVVEAGKVAVDPLQGVPAADFNRNWHVVGSGDFNGDGFSDLLWQYQGPAGDPLDGEVRIWLTRGLQVISDPSAVVTIPLPANLLPDFHLIAAGDFNGDGKSDLLAQYEGPTNASFTTGDIAIGLMNGTTIVGGGLVTAGGQVLHVPSPNWHVIGAGDFNGDGKADILAQYQGPAGDPLDDEVAVARMNGSALLGGPAGLTDLGNPDKLAGGPWTAVGTGVFDPAHPGNADIFFQNAAGDEAMVWIVNSTGTGFTQGPVLVSNFGSNWTLQHG